MQYTELVPTLIIQTGFINKGLKQEHMNCNFISKYKDKYILAYCLLSCSFSHVDIDINFRDLKGHYALGGSVSSFGADLWWMVLDSPQSDWLTALSPALCPYVTHDTQEGTGALPEVTSNSTV